MPAPTRTRVLNLGMQTVALAEFHTSPNGSLTLDRLQLSELLADPGSDATRPAQLAAAIEQLRETTKVGSGPVSYALPSQSVFARYLSLPVSSTEDLNQIIAFEAQQNIPFPIDEVVWDYQPLGEPVDGKLNVVLLAIKTDTLEEVNKSVESAGFAPEVIDVAPMALLNAFHYNYSDQSGCSLIIDVGARTTNLIFVEGSRAYSRSIPVGGSTVTAAIAKEFNQPFEVAEVIKKEKGFVGLGGAYAEPDDEAVGRISKLARTAMTRLHAEVARSISFYRANQGGSQPVRAYLSGGAVGMPYMLDFFAEKMQMPVEFFNPFRNVGISSNVDTTMLSANAHAVGELVGVALRSIGNCPLEINLRPPTVVRAQMLAKRKPFLIAATVCLFLALIQWSVYFMKASAAKEGALDGVSAKVATLQSKADAFAKLKKAQEALAAEAAPVLTALDEREIWIRIIDDLGARLPENFIWITKLTPLSNGRPVTVGAQKQPGTPPSAAAQPQAPATPGEDAPAITAIQIDGLYFDNPNDAKVIDDFVDSLQQSPLFAIAPDQKAQAVTLRSTPNDTTWAYTYSVLIPLKNPIALP